MDLILKYFPWLTDQQFSQFSGLDQLYREWNAKINVISRKDIDNLYLKHILHSLSIAKLISFVPGTQILDVGTGGGFPGIPLAILFPSCHFFLNDSTGKKIKVVEKIALSTGLRNITTICSRVEMIRGQYDFVVSRAVTTFPLFYSWVKDKILPSHQNILKNGILYLKGGDIADETKNFREKIMIFPVSKFFSEEFFRTKLIVYMPLEVN